MNRILKKVILIISASALLLSMLAGCQPVENESESESESGTESETTERDFDYLSANISDYITLSPSEYKNNTVTLGTQYIITDEDVDEYINAQLFENKTKTNGDEQVTDQPIKLGDSAFIYYTGYLDGEKFEGGSNADSDEPHELSIGSGSFIPGFEDGLVGVVPNQTSKDSPFELHVTFPESYHSADLAGKAVVFKVWIEYIVQYTIPEFNDDFVKETLKFDGNAEEYRENIKNDLQNDATEAAESEALSAILNKLIDAAEFHEYPEQSINYWYNAYVDQYEYYMQYYSMYGYKFDSLDDFVKIYLGLKDGEDWKEITRGYAKEIVENSLVYYAIADEQNFSASDEEFGAEAKRLAEYYSSSSKIYTVDEIIETVGESAIKQNIIFEKVENFIMDNCTIEYEDVE
ncbi:MAG: trigger factor [Eubacteriales bacterium]